MKVERVRRRKIDFSVIFEYFCNYRQFNAFKSRLSHQMRDKSSTFPVSLAFHHPSIALKLNNRRKLDISNKKKEGRAAQNSQVYGIATTTTTIYRFFLPPPRAALRTHGKSFADSRWFPHSSDSTLAGLKKEEKVQFRLWPFSIYTFHHMQLCRIFFTYFSIYLSVGSAVECWNWFQLNCDE